jgi:selenocysteine-specific elongation factor
VLAAPGYLLAARTVSVALWAARDAPRPLRHRGRYRFHLGTAETSATLALLEANELAPGGLGLAQLFLAEPAAAVYGQPFVLRAESPPMTLGGGQILQPSATRIRRRDRGAVERLARLRSSDPVERLASALAFQGLQPWTDRDLCRMSGLAVAEVPAGLDRLESQGALTELPAGPRRSVRVLTEFVASLDERVVRALTRLHAARPRQAAIPRAHVVAALPELGNDALVGGILARLAAQGRLVGDDRTVALRDFEPRLTQAEHRLKNELADAIRSGGFSPPDAVELATAAGTRAAVVPELLALLRDEQQVVEISPSLYIDSDAEGEMRRQVAERLADGSTITMAELRDLLGTTRKYAVPIGEYLDRIGWTERIGDLRRLGPAALRLAKPQRPK